MAIAAASVAASRTSCPRRAIAARRSRRARQPSPCRLPAWRKAGDRDVASAVARRTAGPVTASPAGNAARSSGQPRSARLRYGLVNHRQENRPRAKPRAIDAGPRDRLPGSSAGGTVDRRSAVRTVRMRIHQKFKQECAMRLTKTIGILLAALALTPAPAATPTGPCYGVDGAAYCCIDGRPTLILDRRRTASHGRGWPPVIALFAMGA